MMINENKTLKDNQIVVFKLADEEFAIPISEVLEITKLKDITRIPNSPSHVVGVINLRGRIHLIINMTKRLKLEEKTYDEDTRIIIVESDGLRVGMIVDSVTQVLRLDANSVQEVPKVINDKIDARFVGGVVLIGQRMIILLDMVNILGDEKIHAETLKESNQK